MSLFSQIFSDTSPNERKRLITLAVVLLIHSMVVDSNEVVATSGFISNLGASNILLVWAADMLVVVLASGAYSLIVDRVKREQLSIRLFAGFGVVNLALFALFAVHAPDVVAYPVLAVVNDQQWIVLPLVIWALANDSFSMAQGKRLFPLLGAVAIVGGIVGNAAAAAAADVLARTGLGSVELLLVNALLLFVGCAFLVRRLRDSKSVVRQVRAGEGVWENLREGLKFVYEVPSFRYLSVAMFFLGSVLTVVEFQFMVVVADRFADPVELQTFYGAFRVVVLGSILLIQGVATGWLLNRFGLKSIFFAMPGVLFLGALLILALPGALAPILGSYLARVDLAGVDEPARRDFQGLVPDERRGRVSAFMDGYLYPLGTLVGCAVVGVLLLAVNAHLIAPAAGRVLTVGFGVVCAGAALGATALYRFHYDKSMLNWRLKRRPRVKALDALNF